MNCFVMVSTLSVELWLYSKLTLTLMTASTMLNRSTFVNDRWYKNSQVIKLYVLWTDVNFGAYLSIKKNTHTHKTHTLKATFAHSFDVVCLNTIAIRINKRLIIQNTYSKGTITLIIDQEWNRPCWRELDCFKMANLIFVTIFTYDTVTK